MRFSFRTLFYMAVTSRVFAGYRVGEKKCHPLVIDAQKNQECEDRVGDVPVIAAATML
jgi:hypothetical protein